jgi:hypothetical protein
MFIFSNLVGCFFYYYQDENENAIILVILSMLAVMSSLTNVTLEI